MTPRARIWRLFSFCKAPQASRHAPRSRYLRRPSSTETVFRSSSRRLVLANSREATTSGQDRLRLSSQRLVLANSREATTRDRLRSFSRRRTARVLADVAMARPRGPSRSRDQKGEISARPRASRRARRSTARSRTRCTCERKTPASPLVGVAMSRNGAPRWRCYVPQWRPSLALLCPQRRPSLALLCPQTAPLVGVAMSATRRPRRRKESAQTGFVSPRSRFDARDDARSCSLPRRWNEGDACRPMPQESADARGPTPQESAGFAERFRRRNAYASKPRAGAR